MPCEENLCEYIIEKRSVVLSSKANYLRRETYCIDKIQACMEKASNRHPKINDDVIFNNIYGRLYYKKKELDEIKIYLKTVLHQHGYNLSDISEANNAFEIALMGNHKLD